MTRWIVLPICLVSSVALAESRRPSIWDSPRPLPPKVEPAGYTGLGADSLSSDEIAKYGAPPLAPSVSRRMQAMLDIRGSGNGVVTARGDRMFFTSPVTGSPQVWRQDGAMKFPIQLTGGEDRTSVVAMAPDDSFVVVSRDVGGQENPGLYLLDPAGGPLRVIQHTPKVQTSLQYISEDATTLYFRANDLDQASYAIYRHDVKTGTKQLVFDTPGLWSIQDQRSATWLMAKELGNTQVEIYQYDLGTKQLTPLLGQGENEDYDVAYGAKPGQVLVRTNKLGDFHRVYTLDTSRPGATLTPISPAVPFDVERLSIDPQRKRIYWETNENGYRKLTVVDARSLRPLALPKLPDAENVGLAGLSHNGRFAQLSIDGSTLPPTSVTFDWTTRRATTWRMPMTPEIDTTKFARATLESYPARDGTKIPMFVRRPASCVGPCPVVIDFHGGPEGQARAGFNARAQLYVDAGFVIVQPNVRGSTGYGKAWLHADNGPKRLDVVTDIEDAAKFIRSSWTKDGAAPRIGIYGGSYGGYSSLMGMTYFAGAYDAGVQVVGISNLYSFLMNTAPYRRILRVSEYGDPVKDKDALIQLSPITHVSKIKAPLLSIQGVNDPRVPVGEAVQIYKELERRKIPGGLILFADEGHGFSKRSNQVLAIGHTIAFFEKHLLAN